MATLPQSYLEMSQERASSLGLNMQPQTRLMFAAKHLSATAEAEADLLPQLLADLDLSQSLAGFAVIFEQSVLCVVEARPEAVNKFICGVQRSEGFRDARVVVCCEDCSTSMFQGLVGLATRVAPSSHREGQSDIDNEGLADAAYSTYETLVRVGQRMKEKGLGEPIPNQMPMSIALDKLKRSFVDDCMPTHARVVAFTECPAFHSLDEFVQLYCDPINATLESDRIWPIASSSIQ